MALTLAGPYRPRPISPLGTVEDEGWRFKLYGIRTPVCTALGPEWLPVVRRLIRERLAVSGGHPERYGVGFVIVHRGRESNFVLVDWWVGENMLENHVYVSALDEPEALEYVTPSGLCARAWELRVVGFEREAWIETVPANPRGPDLEAYLERRLKGSF